MIPNITAQKSDGFRLLYAMAIPTPVGVRITFTPLLDHRKPGNASPPTSALEVGGLLGYTKHEFASGDLNNLTQGGGYSLNSDVSPVTNGPSIKWGGLIVYNNAEFILQLAYNGIDNTIQARTRNYNGVWNDWLTFKYA